MNLFQNTSSGAGLLKDAYPGKGAVGQMNDKNPEIHAVRKRRDLIGKKQTLKKG